MFDYRINVCYNLFVFKEGTVFIERTIDKE